MTRKLRHKLRVSQSGLARLLGVTIRSVSRWETGKARPTPSIQRQIDILKKEAKT